jgi:hypothetical protein
MGRVVNQGSLFRHASTVTALSMNLDRAELLVLVPQKFYPLIYHENTEQEILGQLWAAGEPILQVLVLGRVNL